MKSLALLPALAVISLALPGGCVSDRARPTVEFPALPDLPPEVLKECPGADPLTGELGDLAAKDATLAVEYARCKARKDAAVGAYQDAQKALRAAAAKANGPVKR